MAVDTTRHPRPDAGAAQRGPWRRGVGVIRIALRDAAGPFTVGFVAATLYAAMTVVASLVLGWATDEVLLPTIAAGEVDARLLAVAVVLILGVALLKGIGVVGRRLGAYVAQYVLQARYRRKVTSRYLDLPLTWHRRHPTGQLLSTANTDVESAFFVAAPLPMALGAIVLLVVTAGLLVVTDPFLAAIGLSVGPLLGIANGVYQRRMRFAAAVAQQARGEVAASAHESFDTATVIKTLGREAQETERFAKVTGALRDRLVVVGRLRAAFDPVIEALPNIGILLVLVVGAVRMRDGMLTAGDLVVFAYLFRLLAMPMRVFGWLLGDLPRAVAGWDRVERVLTADEDMAYGDADVPGSTGARAAMRAVGYHHPPGVRDTLAVGRRAAAAPEPAPETGAAAAVPPESPDDGASVRGIDDVTFDATAGGTLALVGPTGSGKSTIASLMVRLYDPDRGQVLLDGRDLVELSREALPERTAIVFQEAFLFSGTVRDNITLGADASDDEVADAARLAQAHDFITALEHGYDTAVGERGATLSGGQRQRIALARALLRRPRLLVLDDATSAVDPAVETRILTGLAAADLPTTVLLVAYRLSAIRLADEVVYLDGGRVVAQDTHERLMRTVDAYRDLVTAYEREAAGGPGAADELDGSSLPGVAGGSGLPDGLVEPRLPGGIDELRGPIEPDGGSAPR